MNNGVAACGYTFDPTDYYRQAVSNMDGRPKLTFQSCRCSFRLACALKLDRYSALLGGHLVLLHLSCCVDVDLEPSVLQLESAMLCLTGNTDNQHFQELQKQTRALAKVVVQQPGR